MRHWGPYLKIMVSVMVSVVVGVMVRVRLGKSSTARALNMVRVRLG